MLPFPNDCLQLRIFLLLSTIQSIMLQLMFSPFFLLLSFTFFYHLLIIFFLCGSHKKLSTDNLYLTKYGDFHPGNTSYLYCLFLFFYLHIFLKEKKIHFTVCHMHTLIHPVKKFICKSFLCTLGI